MTSRPPHLAKTLEKVQFISDARVTVTEVGAKDLEGMEGNWRMVLLSSRVLALSLDQPDSGEVTMSKLMGDSVGNLRVAVGDGVANVNWMIAAGRVALDIFDVF